jgi:hypothetical protein
VPHHEPQIIKELIYAGADATIKNKSGELKKRPELVRLLPVR